MHVCVYYVCVFVCRCITAPYQFILQEDLWVRDELVVITQGYNRLEPELAIIIGIYKVYWLRLASLG